MSGFGSVLSRLAMWPASAPALGSNGPSIGTAVRVVVLAQKLRNEAFLRRLSNRYHFSSEELSHARYTAAATSHGGPWQASPSAGMYRLDTDNMSRITVQYDEMSPLQKLWKTFGDSVGGYLEMAPTRFTRKLTSWERDRVERFKANMFAGPRGTIMSIRSLSSGDRNRTTHGSFDHSECPSQQPHNASHSRSVSLDTSGRTSSPSPRLPLLGGGNMPSQSSSSAYRRLSSDSNNERGGIGPHGCTDCNCSRECSCRCPPRRRRRLHIYPSPPMIASFRSISPATSERVHNQTTLGSDWGGDRARSSPMEGPPGRPPWNQNRAQRLDEDLVGIGTGLSGFLGNYAISFGRTG